MNQKRASESERAREREKREKRSSFSASNVDKNPKTFSGEKKPISIFASRSRSLLPLLSLCPPTPPKKKLGKERRPLPPAAQGPRLLLRLGPRALDDGPGLLQVDAVDLPAAFQQGPGLPGHGARQLVPRPGHGPRQRGGRRGRERTRRAPRGPPADEAVDAADHRVRGQAARGARRARVGREHQGAK